MEEKDKPPEIPPDLLDKVRRKEIANLLKRVQEGGTLTAAQWSRILEFTGKDPTSEDATASTIAELCERLGISRPTFYSLRRRFPKQYPKQSSNGSWPVAQWRLFAKSKGIETEDQTLAGSIGEDEKYGLEVNLLKIKCRTAAIEYFRLASEFISRAEVNQRIGTMMATLRSRLLAIPNAVSLKAEGKNAAEISSILDEHIRSTLEQRCDIE